MKTKSAVRHPDGEQLLRYADGELRASKAREIRLHLEACWECRTELEELQSLVGECVRYRKNVLDAFLPSPTAPWGDIYQGFARIDASRHDVSLFLRLWQGIRWATLLPATAAAALVCFLVLEYRHTPSVQAAELLQKAVMAADSRPHKLHVIHIRTSKQQVTRRIGPEELMPAATAADTETLLPVQSLFQAANYSWEDPLSAKSYLAWHDRLSNKQDDVTNVAEPSGENYYRVRTISGSGEVTQATLKLRAKDLQPIEERLEFRNRDWVEITEGSEEETVPVNAPVAEAGKSVAAAPGIAANPERAGHITEATIADELQVLAALHRIGADLGDPIEVKRNGSQVLVTGVGIDPQRQREVHGALDSSGNVVVRFSEPVAGVAPGGQDSPAAVVANPEALQFRNRMEKQLGSHQDFEQLSAQILDMSETMMSRAYAVRRLAERFPIDVESQMGAGDRQLLSKINREHAAVLTQQAAKIERLLSGVLVPMGGAAASVSRSAMRCDSWQPCAEELFRSARRVETLLAGMLGVTADGTLSAQLPSQVLSGLAQLRVNSEAYEHLTALDPAVR